ncbi:MAG: hypothetical protein U1C51_09235 [Candidatus Izemoplasmatales bacterium]|nr:hypothetical protein [bacterium]MDZ4197410.1 hypothetical protein [Candidatus Izemoplasmatales bacterium]
MVKTVEKKPRFHQLTFIKVVLVAVIFNVFLAFVNGLLSSLVQEGTGFDPSNVLLFLQCLLIGKMVRRLYDVSHVVYPIVTVMGLLLASSVIIFLPEVLVLANQMGAWETVFQVKLYVDFAFEFYNPINWIQHFSVAYMIQLLIVFAGITVSLFQTNAQRNTK